jgi:hypothetical protein
MQSVRIKSSFLGEFSAGGRGDVLRGIAEEAAGQGCCALVRIDAALNKQHVQARLPQGQDHQVNGEQHGGRPPKFVVGHVPRLIIVNSTVNSPKVTI